MTPPSTPTPDSPATPAGSAPPGVSGVPVVSGAPSVSASPAVSVAPDLVAVSGPTASVAPAGHPVPSPGLQRFGAVGGVLLALGLGVPGAVEAFTGETAATNREIASRLRLTEGTVKNHVSRILTRLSLRDRTQAALYARDQGLL